MVDGIVVETEYAAVFDGGGIDQFRFGESFAEVVNLVKYSFLGQTEAGDLL